MINSQLSHGFSTLYRKKNLYIGSKKGEYPVNFKYLCVNKIIFHRKQTLKK